ncbi:MAG: hypothetical protein R2827_08955 [Bdellovibrionales bacterium]
MKTLILTTIFVICLGNISLAGISNPQIFEGRFTKLTLSPAADGACATIYGEAAKSLFEHLVKLGHEVQVYRNYDGWKEEGVQSENVSCSVWTGNHLDAKTYNFIFKNKSATCELYLQ